MSKEELLHYTGLLYEIVEPSNLNAIQVEQVAETLKLLNPSLDANMAAGIAADHDSKGKQTLNREDFGQAVVFALQTTDMGDSIQLVRDLTIRMRVAFRRRYLMYDAPASTPPPAILENAKAVSMYRELWDYVSNGGEIISRQQLRKLATTVLYDQTAEASNVAKAAIGDRETDTITFLEFLMVMRQATQSRSLSEMVAVARRKFDQGQDMQMAASRKISSIVHGAGFGSDKADSIATQLKDNARLQQEVAAVASSENIAAERARSVLFGGNSSGVISLLSDTLPVVPQPLSPPRAAVDAALERELAKLRTENEKLHHALAIAGVKLPTSSGSGTTEGGAGVVAGGGAAAAIWNEHQQSVQAAKSQREREQGLQKRVQQLEEELRQARAQLAISTEAAELTSLLREPGVSRTQVLKEHFIEESNLLSKHRYIREVAERFQDPNSPVSLLIGQYELLVSGYQSLYRDLKQKWEFAKTKRFNPLEAAKNIVQQAQSATPASRPLMNASPVQVNSAVFSWAELDCAPSDQLRHTGLPGDPLLTDQERHNLRAKLAAHMRSTARHYTPNRASAGRSTPRPRTPSHLGGSYSPDTADAHSDSIDAIRQLQALTPSAYARRF